jgi:hypothetical protein
VSAVARLGLELHCSNRKRIALDYASHASATALGRIVEGDGAECRLDGDDLTRFGESLAAVHVDTVDRVIVAVDKQHRVDLLFDHGTDPIAVAQIERRASR